MARVIIGVDPHKRSATIEVINEREQTIGQGRFGTDTAGYKAMLAAGRRHADREWAVEGCNGIGRHVAQRLVADRLWGSTPMMTRATSDSLPESDMVSAGGQRYFELGSPLWSLSAPR